MGYETRKVIHTHPLTACAVAMNAWNAGADGVYIFNLFNPNAPQWRELGDPKMLLTLEKVYHGSTVTIERNNRHMPDGVRFRTRPMLSPEFPETLKPDEPLITTINIGENVLWGKDQGVLPRLSLEPQVQSLDDASGTITTINGHRLERGELVDGWLQYKLKPRWVRQGNNEVQIRLRNGRSAGPVVRDLRLRIAYGD